MRKLLLTVLAGLALLSVLFFAPMLLLMSLGGSPVQKSTPACVGQNFAAPGSVNLTGSNQLSPPLSAPQLHYAGLILGVAKNRQLSARDAAIGVMVAAQESSLSNETAPTPSNADSVGLFQQRPSQGWGTFQQLSDPVIATNKFFNSLEQVKARNAVPMWKAGQDVQHSADGTLYAQWQHDALVLTSQAYGRSAAGSSASRKSVFGTKPAFTGRFGPVGTVTSCNQQAVTLAMASGSQRKIVHAALSQLGLRYLWGGNIPKGLPGAGLDCSGLTHWAYAQAGIAIPRVANDQYNAAKKKFKAPANPASLQPGDLLFENWNEPGNGPGWGHVGMYVGGGKVVEEPQTGEVAKVLPYSQFNPSAVGRYITAPPRSSIASGGQPQGPTASGVLSGKVVVIDPGHNGGNAKAPGFINRPIWNGRQHEACDTTGTQTNSGYTEARFNWNVAGQLAADLRAEGARVILTRSSNSGVGPCVTQRTAIGNRAGADAAVSIHADGGPPGGHGFAVLTPVADGPNNAIVDPSATLGIDLRNAFRAGTGEQYSTYDGVRGIQPRSDLAGTNLSTVPKVFIECANMRNSADAARVTSPQWQARAAQAIARGLTAFLTHH